MFIFKIKKTGRQTIEQCISTYIKIYNNLEKKFEKKYVTYSIHEWPDSPTSTG